MKKYTKEELKETLRLHKIWVESNKEDGEKTDLSFADLRGADLSGADLNGTIF